MTQPVSNNQEYSLYTVTVTDFLAFVDTSRSVRYGTFYYSIPQPKRAHKKHNIRFKFTTGGEVLRFSRKHFITGPNIRKMRSIQNIYKLRSHPRTIALYKKTLPLHRVKITGTVDNSFVIRRGNNKRGNFFRVV